MAKEELEKRLARGNAAESDADVSTGNPASLVLLPPESMPEAGGLLDLAYELNGAAQALGANLPAPVKAAIGDLVRGMNCYYSNLIEGRVTYPVDIDRALREERPAAADAKRRDLQREAAAHIAVQGMIDRGEFDAIGTDTELVKRIHREFYLLLPEDLHWTVDPATGARQRVIPGEFRTGGVAVGKHHAVHPDSINGFMTHFSWGYAKGRVPARLSPIAALAAHHRLLWIHPFLDGNGRVSRLHTHALFRRWGVGSELWSVSRGFARTKTDYYDLLARADYPRQDTADGRGTLSDRGLAAFCSYGLRTALEQIDFMGRLLEPRGLIERTRDFMTVEARRFRAREARPDGLDHLREEAAPLLERLYLVGEVTRMEARQIIGGSESTARRILKTLRDRHLIVSVDSHANFKPAFPLREMGFLFPGLLPPGIPMDTRDEPPPPESDDDGYGYSLPSP